MSRLDQHLDHILSDVVPTRGAAQAGMDPAYVGEIEARAQPPHLVRGLEQWNAGRFYEQHETLEWLWRATHEPVRDALKGIIQSGVGAYHVLNKNRRGALGKWTGATGYLAPFEGLHPYGIDTGGLRAQIAQARQALLDDETPDWDAHQARVRTLQVRWEARIPEPRVTALLRRLDQAWQESPSSLEASIAGLTEAEAEWRVAEGVPSVRELLQALGGRKIEVARRCFGERGVEIGDWRLEIGSVAEVPAAWGKFLRWLTEAQDAIREPLGFLRDEQLDEARATDGGSRTIEGIIEETIEDDLYTAGRIGMLREVQSSSTAR